MTVDMVITSEFLCMHTRQPQPHPSSLPFPLVILALRKEGRKIDTSITLKKRVTKEGNQNVQQETTC